MCEGSHKLIPSSSSNHYAGLCLPNLDFVYTSPLWHSSIEEYPEGVDAKHPSTTGGNALYRAYADSQFGGITHLRIEMNTKTIDVAVAVALSGRYTLQQLVTNPGGSEASPKGDGNVKSEQRGNVGSLFGFPGTHFVCNNVGFNHLQSGGDQDGSTGWHSMSQDGARARIGVYKSSSFPCGSMKNAEGIGLDMEHGRPVGPSGEGGRVGSGTISSSSVSIFSHAKVYVARKFPATRVLRRDVYQQFGNSEKFLKQDVLSIIHASLPFGVKGGSYHFTFAFFYRFRRHYYWAPGWNSRNIFRYGSSNREFLPAIHWKQCHRSQHWTSRQYWSDNRYSCRRLEFVVSTDRISGGNEQYYEQYDGESTVTLTLGKWHHLAYSCNKHSCTSFIDGSVHTVYTIPPGDSGADVSIKVARERLLYIAQERDFSGSQIYDFRNYNNVALSESQIRSLASLYPPKSCGDGVRVEGEECDDGNIINGDGCNNECVIETGYVCRSGNTTSLSADMCDPGTYMINLDFEQTAYNLGMSSGSVDITSYNVMEWGKNPSVPKIYEHFRKDGNVITRRKGNVEVSVGAKYAHSGTKGLRLHFRDYYYTKEYSPSPAEIANFELPENSIYSENANTPQITFTDATTSTSTETSSTDNGQRTTSLVGETGWVHGPWMLANSDSTTTKRVTNTWNSVKVHSLVRVQMRYWVHGSWCANDHVAVDVDGDTIFAHTKNQAGTNEKFRDGLADGPAYGTAYVSPTSNAASPLTVDGHMASRYWNIVDPSVYPDTSDITDDPKTWRIYDIDVVVPHQDSDLSLNVRAIIGSCGSSTAWAFDKVRLQVSDLTISPFRPYNFGQLRNRNRVQQEAHSWIQFDTPNNVQQSSWLSFSFKATKIARTGRQFIINLIDLDHAKTTFHHGDCLATTNCATETGCSICRPANIFYRICYWNQMTGTGVSGCDESHFPTYGAWHDETIIPSEKFASIYDAAIAYTPRKLRIQFLSFSSGQSNGGSDSEFDLHLDNIRVGTPTKYTGTKGCGDVEVSSNTADTVDNTPQFKINTIPISVTKVGNNGFCYMHVPYAVTPLAAIATVQCGASGDFATFVNSVDRNDRIFVATYGVAVECDATCVNALIALGGVGVKWREGSSMVLAGRMGAKTGSTPMRLEHVNEGRVKASNVILCPDITTSTSEISTQFTTIGPPLGLLNSAKPLDAKFVITPASGGYLGCYRDKYTSGNMQNADMWFSNSFGRNAITPSTCAWMCREKGFTLSSNDHYSYHCRCGDTYGSYTCDTHGHCGLPRLEDSQCQLPCTYSDRLQSCGGHHYYPRSIAVYQTTGENYVLPNDIETVTCDATSTACSLAYDGSNTADWKSTTGSYGKGVSSTIILELKFPKRLSALRILWSISGDHSRASKLIVGTKSSGGTYVEVANQYVDSENITSKYQLIRFSSHDAQFVRVSFVGAASRGTAYVLREMWLNYYVSTLEEQNAALLQSSKLLSSDNVFTPSKISFNLTMLQGGPQFYVKNYFQIGVANGQIFLHRLLLDYEAVSEYRLVVAAYATGYDSGWFDLSSQKGTASYMQLTHALGVVPGVQIVLVKSKSSGWMYPAIGTVQADERYNEHCKYL